MAGNGLPDMGGVHLGYGWRPTWGSLQAPPLSKVNERLKPWALGTGWGGVRRARSGGFRPVSSICDGSAPCHLSVTVSRPSCGTNSGRF